LETAKLLMMYGGYLEGGQLEEVELLRRALIKKCDAMLSKYRSEYLARGL
jgi:hypothetical protein